MSKNGADYVTKYGEGDVPVAHVPKPEWQMNTLGEIIKEFCDDDWNKVVFPTLDQQPARVSFHENSGEFFSYFTSRSRSRGFSISLSLLEKSEIKNQFTFHFSKRVKREMISLFISRKKAIQILLFFLEKKEWNQISATVNFCRNSMQNTTKCNKYRMIPELNFHFLLFIPLF